MIFRHRSHNAVYVLLPRARQVDPTSGIRRPPTKGLRAEFQNGYWDSDKAAKLPSNRWTEEEKLEVENYLLLHEDFNRQFTLGLGGLSLAPGQVLSPERRALVPGTITGIDDVEAEPGSAQAVAEEQVAPRIDLTDRRCRFVSYGLDGAEPCGLMGDVLAETGWYCKDHATEAGVEPLAKAMA